MLQINKLLLLINLFISFYILSEESILKISKLNPDSPYTGTVFSILGNGFNNNTTLIIDNYKINNDSLDVLEWNNNLIKIILPDLNGKSNISINSKINKIFNSRRLITVEYFNPVKYLLNYTVTIDNIQNLDPSSDKVFIYVPQPILSDETIAKTTLSITPFPKYVQDNDVYIYELDPKTQNRFIFNQEIEVTTVYKKISFDNTSDVFDYEKDSNFYNYYTKASPPFIIPNNDIIQNKIKVIIANEKNRFEITKKIYQWVIDRMTHIYPPEDRNPLYSIEKGEGDCLSDAFLFISLARAAGLPSRMNAGYIFYHNYKFGSLHFWEDVFIPGSGWIPIDISYSHNPGFLNAQKFETNTNFYFGGVDGRRISFSRGRLTLMKPDKDGKLIFYRYLDYIQVPYLSNNADETKLKYELKKRWMTVKSITPLYNDNSNYFKK